MDGINYPYENSEEEEQPTYLTNIDWKETSGVRLPANKITGWLVMKNIQNEILEILRKDYAQFEKLERLYKIMKEETDWVKEHAPKEIVLAFEKVLDWLQAQYEGYAQPTKAKDSNSEYPEPDGYPKPSKKSADDLSIAWYKKTLEKILNVFSKNEDENTAVENEESAKQEESVTNESPQQVDISQFQKDLIAILQSDRSLAEKREAVTTLFNQLRNTIKEEN